MATSPKKTPRKKPSPAVAAPTPVATLQVASAERLTLLAGARDAIAAIHAEGEATNTRLSYQSAGRYWKAWHEVRYGVPLTLPTPVEVVLQFLVDHFARQGPHGRLVHELPADMDRALVEAGFKGELGPLKVSTIVHRVSVLSKLHKVKGFKQVNPCRDERVLDLLKQAKKAAAKRGDGSRSKQAATLDVLTKLLETCDDSLMGCRDRALLLFAWASGGRRRSEVAAAQRWQFHDIGADFGFHLPHSKTNQDGAQEVKLKPVKGDAALALRTWLTRAGISEGFVFRRVLRRTVKDPTTEEECVTEVVGEALSPWAVGEIVKRRAKLANLQTNGQFLFAAHSLRSGYVTEAGNQNAPIPDAMAMTEHRTLGIFMRYYQSGQLFNSKASDLLSGGGNKKDGSNE